MSKVFHQNVLALDTSTLTQSIALCAGGVLMSERVLKTRRGHASSLLATLDAVVQDARLTLEDMDLLVVGAGPGSFTGLRIGMACLKGLAFTTQIPLVTVSSLKAIAAQAGPGPGLVVPTIDARKQEVYAGLYRNDGHGTPSAVVPDRAFSLDALIGAIAEHRQPNEPIVAMGSAMATYGARLSEALPDLTRLDDAYGFPRAAHLARIAARIAPEDIPPLDSMEPNYQRLSDAEINFDKKAAR
jgi:tRNA threonylcarbamoyladenosine biosynthesis protein TsaB